MKKTLTLLVILAMFAGFNCSDVNLKEYKSCGRPCYPGPEKTNGIGACKPGVYVCDDNSENPVCVNAVTPQEEICDNIDNDCDGKTDNIKKNCSSACENGTQTCLNGTWGACTARQPSQELCNNADDDCDGVIDNEDKIPVEFCYDGPSGTVTHGECHPGVKKCSAGQYVACENQGLPKPETCNQKDDDCNGIVDDNHPIKEVYNIVILDLSGSMDSYLFAIKQGFNLWKNSFINSTRQKFALILIPNPTDITLVQPRLSYPFSDITSFVLNIASTTINNYIAQEPTLDALKMIVDPADPLGLKLSESDSKRIILFSDEIPQSYFYRTNNDINSVAQEYKNANIPVYLFIKDQQWEPIATLSGGDMFNLPTISMDVFNVLKSILIEDSCE
jgi:hypothetical protein